MKIDNRNDLGSELLTKPSPNIINPIKSFEKKMFQLERTESSNKHEGPIVFGFNPN